MTTHRDPREVLGVGPDAAESEVREAFRARMRELHPDHNRPDNSATHDQIAAVVDAYRKLRGPDPIDESNSAPDWSTAKQWAGAEHDQPFEFDPRNEGGHTPPVRLLRPMVVVTVLVLSAWLVIFGLIAFAQSGENGTVDRQNDWDASSGG